MAKRPNPAQLRQQQSELIVAAIAGRSSASSSSLSRSYGLSVEDVRRILQSKGVTAND